MSALTSTTKKTLLWIGIAFFVLIAASVVFGSVLMNFWQGNYERAITDTSKQK